MPSTYKVSKVPSMRRISDFVIFEEAFRAGRHAGVAASRKTPNMLPIPNDHVKTVAANSTSIFPPGRYQLNSNNANIARNPDGKLSVWGRY